MTENSTENSISISEEQTNEQEIKDLPKQGESQDSQNGENEQPDQEQEQPKPRAQRRIEQLIEKSKAKDEIISKIEQEKQELLEKIKNLENVERPDAEKYDDDDEYEIDKTAYIQQKALEKQERKRLEALELKAKKEREKYAQEASRDFREKIEASTPELKQSIQKNISKYKPRNIDVEIDIIQSDYGVEIFDVIIQDSERFNSMSDKQFIREIAKIEAKFENAQKGIKPPLSVPNPPQSFARNGSGSAEKNTNPEWGKFTFAQAYKMR